MPFKSASARPRRLPRLAVAPLPAALLAAVLAAPAPAVAQGKVYAVTDRTELAAAIKAVKAGDSILLAPGNYGDVRIFRRKIEGGTVRIASASGSRRASMSYVNLEGSEGFHFSLVDFQGANSPLVNAATTRNLQFSNVRFLGQTPNLDPWDDTNAGLWIRGSTNVSVTDSEFQDLRVAIYIQRSYDAKILRNNFTFLREGINIASLGGGEISFNQFHSFYPNFGLKEHPDAIQLWTRGETWGSYDLMFRNNYFALGGPRAVHGIFGRSEEAESYKRPVYHRNFTITGNIYYGSALHGVSLSSLHGGKIYNNVAVASPHGELNNSNIVSADGRTGGGLLPQVRITNSLDVEAWGNVSMNVPANSRDHVQIYAISTRRGEPWTTVFAGRPTAEIPPLSDFVTVPNTAAAARGIGVLKPFQVGPARGLGAVLTALPKKP